MSALPTALFKYEIQGIEDGEDLPLHRLHFLLKHCGHPTTCWSSRVRSAIDRLGFLKLRHYDRSVFWIPGENDSQE